MNDVVSACAQAENLRAVAIIVGLEGPAYRPLGAMMAIFEDQSFEGHVSSGCIEADIVAQCQNLKEAKVVRYGLGSPYMDLKLPCGGGMDILLIPNPDQTLFQQVEQALLRRTPIALCLSLVSGEMSLSEKTETVATNREIHIRFEPPIRFFVFGNGHEARIFSDLANGAGHPVQLFSTSDDTLNRCKIPPEAQHLMTCPKIGNLTEIDHRTAIVLFFHDHDLEEAILTDALKTDAFYIGAQGSFKTHQKRIAGLKALQATGVERVRGPIGLIPSTRDPQTLAISVLAEVHSVASQMAQ